MASELTLSGGTQLQPEEQSLLAKSLVQVREELHNNTYIQEAIRVLPVKGYRSAIGSYWNAVVDDLRRKIEHRSLDLFNKEMKPKQEIKIYEDFQKHVTDFDLIEGAYKTGVIGWEAHKMLHQARETRHVFDGHPTSTEPSILKVLDMINDCNKYVLSEEYPVPIVDIDTYLQTMDSPSFHQNKTAVEQALGDLPQIYRKELINRLYSTYQHQSATTVMRGNTEFILPILWSVLSKEDRKQIGQRLDKDFVEGDKDKCEYGVDFMLKVNGLRYVSSSTRNGLFEPAIEKLEQSLDKFEEEKSAMLHLRKLGSSVPPQLIPRLVQAMTHTYVGHKGFSLYYNRSDFYSDGATPIIKEMFEQFDDASIKAFIEVVKISSVLRLRIAGPGQMRRLRNLGQILLDKQSLDKDDSDFLALLVNEAKEGELYALFHRLKKAVEQQAKKE